ncbi:MAG: hypothetical protein HYX65_08835 [Gemmatimonadetes bacterium]|nr:hypothetical protein [Gemmatimonadota bacterium]
MNISDTDKQVIVDWLNAKCGQMRCTCCGYGKWEILPIATLPIALDLRSTRFFYSQGLPQVGVLCTNCGHVLYFSPAVIGIKPDEPQAANPAD